MERLVRLKRTETESSYKGYTEAFNKKEEEEKKEPT
jgi:hypothetical protein